ncbi:MAG: hypothetical protein EOL87_14520 [Spartobacteria bacterium]|nr:hypothetical protein [Spartobacteria bacterium]
MKLKSILATAYCGLLIFCFLCVAPSHGQALYAGAKAVRLDGGIDFSTPDGTASTLDLGYGIYIRDYVQAGASFGVVSSDNEKIYHTGIYLERDFDLGVPFYPTTGVHLDVGTYDTYGNDGMAVIAGVKIGILVFPSQSVGMELAGKADYASDSIYADAGDISHSDIRLELGVRYTF